MTDDGNDYPPEAYSPDGTLWWRVKIRPGAKKAKFGDEPKIAAWLAFNRQVGEIFTMRQLRAALGEDQLPNDKEHLNRRLRTLRLRDGWLVPSARDDGTLATDEYRVQRVGWHPGTGRPRPVHDLPSNKVRRKVFERDKWTCVVCGTASKEPYDDLPEKAARLTLGHRVPGKRLTRKATIDELQAECARCNEPVRDEVFDPVTLPEVLPTIKGLKRPDKERLLHWLQAGHRTREQVEQAYADARRLSADERSSLIAELRKMTGRPDAE